MIPFWALIVLAGSAVVAVLLMLAARRFVAKDGLLADAVPAAAVFGVLGVAFAVLLAFVMFLAFENYIRAHEGASREAVAISQLDRLTGLFPAPQREELRDGLTCYARAVVSDEWRRMRCTTARRPSSRARLGLSLAASIRVVSASLIRYRSKTFSGCSCNVAGS